MSDPRVEMIKKALADPKLRAELLKDPKAAIEKALGVKVPAGLTVKVFEDSASVVHLILPQSGRGALSDADLGAVSGGYDPSKPAPGWSPNCQNNTAGSGPNPFSGPAFL